MIVSTAAICSECSTPGSGFSSTARIQLKTVAFPPMPSASVNTATAVNPGFFRSVRTAKLKSCDSDPIPLPRVFAGLFHGDDDQRGIVMPVAAAKVAGGLQDYFLQILGARVAIFFEQLEQARFAELLAFRNMRFRDAIGKKQHAVAGPEVVCAGGKLLNGKYAENAAAIQQAIVRAVAMKHDRRIVAGVGITQPASRAVQLSVEKRDEAVGGNIS